jgi:hypothetical protein
MVIGLSCAHRLRYLEEKKLGRKGEVYVLDGRRPPGTPPVLKLTQPALARTGLLPEGCSHPRAS